MNSKSIRTLKNIGGQRYRECYGMFYDNFTVGDIYEHWPGRTVTEADCYWQTHLHANPHPLHFDDDFASTTEFGQVVVSSLVTLPLVHSMSVAATSVNAIANLGWEHIRLSAPVYVGDTLCAETEVVEKRISSSRPGHGIVKVLTRGYKKDDVLVITFERSFLIAQSTAQGD
ncbi:MaoC family dehydratase [Pseudomonas fluorescens]|uniref:MaoC family dehydratase n=1 Tax=Pseudomonas fluorescens TaxID=294 RepID=UPI000F4A86B3|nr:MaoC family dehydratase [Pseudomonas fluorescens]